MRRLLVCLIFCIFLSSAALAHPGRTDSQGGHTNHSTGEYHYHHSHEAHQHPNGVCPFDFDDKAGSSSGSSSSASGSFSSVSRSTPQPTQTPKPSRTPKPSKTPSPSQSTRSYPITYVNGKPVKEDDSVSFAQLLPCLSLGFALGSIFSSLLWCRHVARIRRDDAARLALVESENARKTERALLSMKEQDSKDFEHRLATEKHLWTMSLASESNKLADNLRKELEAEKNKYIKYKAWMEQTASDRYAKAERLTHELHQLNYQPETVSIIESIINTKHDPDLSEGAVYVKRDLPVAVYHYRSFCTDDLVLASKATMKSLGFKPCPCCFNMSQPVLDPQVAISDSASEVYHDIGAPCIKHGGKVVFLSYALKKGRRPCKMCKPVGKLPDVWY